MADKNVAPKKVVGAFEVNIRGKIFWKVEEDECEAVGITPERAFADWKNCHETVAPNDRTRYIFSPPIPHAA